MKTWIPLMVLLILLPLHSKTIFSCSGDSDSDLTEALQPAHTDAEEEPSQPEAPEDTPKPRMKVVVLNMNPQPWENVFYLRSAYNDEKDVIIMFSNNMNCGISPRYIFLGSNSWNDAQLMDFENMVVRQEDSTAPLYEVQQYWALFCQHGYVVPTIENDAGFAADDVGAVWNDQLGRSYTIGEVTDLSVTLLPVIYKDSKGHDARGWQGPSSPKITRLSHVSGGGHTDDVAVSNQTFRQLYPISRFQDRQFLADGKAIDSAGVYEADEFSVSETELGYDPATVGTWLPAVLLDGAEVMARFERKFNFCGLQCFVESSIEILRPVECQSYGATQQQTFHDKGDYKAMFMVPKAAPQNGIELDKPFASSSSAHPTFYFYRTSEYLKNVDDPIDRLIAFLHNDANDDYHFGIAVGLSLIDGETRPERRLENIPVGNYNLHYRLGSLSPANTNKFYIAAVNTAPFEADDYYFPTGYHKQINYYVCLFDPSENTGQVYWYKDGEQFVIYAHCQSQQEAVSLTMPDMMEGYGLDIVEKTNGAQLLSSRVEEGRINVSYSTDEANYLVLTATPQP